jgi:hypothetical protein
VGMEECLQTKVVVASSGENGSPNASDGGAGGVEVYKRQLRARCSLAQSSQTATKINVQGIYVLYIMYSLHQCHYGARTCT